MAEEEGERALRVMVTGIRKKNRLSAIYLRLPRVSKAVFPPCVVRLWKKLLKYLSSMPANEALLNRLREILEDTPAVEEKAMFNGVTFMVNDKMCVGVSKDELMCRIGPDAHDAAVEQPGVRAMMMGNKEYRGYVFVSPEVLRTKQQLQHWVNLCLAYNPQAQSSKKKSTPKKKAANTKKA